VLYEQVHEGRGVLKQYGQHMLTATLSRMMEAAVSHSEALADYGVAADAIDAALKAIAKMEEAQSSVRSAITGKKAMTESVPDILESGRLALAKMDRIVHVFEAQDAAFVSGYRTARGTIRVSVKPKDDASDVS
jgi:hypothetical protein